MGSNCNRCLKPLTDWRSVQRGFGPICFAKTFFEEMFEDEDADQEDRYMTLGREEFNKYLSRLEKVSSFSIKGEFQTRKIWINEMELTPGPSQAIYNHSPDGFMWGYGGSGPSQLALAILLHVTGHKGISKMFYQMFKWDFVAGLPQADFEAKDLNIFKWLKKKGETELQ